MREILFRGKRVDNSEWVYGYPLIDTAPCSLKADGKCVCPHNGSDAIMFCWDDESHEYDSVDIIPETIGQYTGLSDKNGAKIFEGDIVNYVEGEHFSDDEGPEDAGTKYRRKDVIKYENGEFFLRPMQEHVADEWYSYGLFDFEVIGNVHDNPELIEG